MPGCLAENDTLLIVETINQLTERLAATVSTIMFFALANLCSASYDSRGFFV